MKMKRVKKNKEVEFKNEKKIKKNEEKSEN